MLGITRTGTTSETKIKQAYYVTDPEGNWDFFMQAINNWQFDHDKIPVLICGGDVTDKGNGDLRILKYLVTDFIHDHPGGEQHYILGNRDKNKIRYLQELSSIDHLDNLLERNSAPLWADNDGNKPLSFLREVSDSNSTEFTSLKQALSNKLPEKNIDRKDYSDDELKTAYSELTLKQKQFFALAWMQKKTMGIPNGINNRRSELAIILKKNESEITDDMIVDSYIEQELQNDAQRALLATNKLVSTDWVLPADYQGLSIKYRELANEVILFGDTLLTHSALKTGFIDKPQYPLQPTASLNFLIRNLNADTKQHEADIHQLIFRENNNSFTAYDLSNGVAQDDFNKSALPNTFTSYNHLGESGNPDTQKLLSETEQELLKNAGVKYILHGHQPNLSGAPSPYRIGANLIGINADTNMSDMSQKDEQRRGSANYQYRIYLQTDDQGREITTHTISCNFGEKSRNLAGYIYLTDLQIGTFIEIDGKQYLIQAKQKNSNNYILTLREAPQNGKGFASIPAESGFLTLSADKINTIRSNNASNLADIIDPPSSNPSFAPTEEDTKQAPSRVHAHNNPHAHSSPSALGLFKKPACYAGMGLGTTILLGTLYVAAALAVFYFSGGMIPGLYFALNMVGLLANATNITLMASAGIVVGAGLVSGAVITAGSLFALKQVKKADAPCKSGCNQKA
jgi:hypothetical protein